MKIVFLTNYFNDHLKEFCDGLYEIYHDEFIFLQTGDNANNYEKSRIPQNTPSYVLNLSPKHFSLIKTVDVLIVGSAPYSIIQDRVRDDVHLTFLYQERPLKRFEPLKFFYRYVKWRKRYVRKNNCYVLCASSFTSKDYKKFGLFSGKCLRFGYFPNRYNGDISYKDKTIDTIFVARLVPLKHPEIFVRLCKKSTKENPSFKACIIGTGPLYSRIKRLLEVNDLSKNVTMVGYADNKVVLNYMKMSKSLVFCSDSREGWGAVVNESMSCGCVPFISSRIGSAEFLIKNDNNGYIFSSFKELDNSFKYFLESQNAEVVSSKAKITIDTEWNGLVAAQRFAKLLEDRSSFDKYKNGPLSIIQDD